MPRPRFALDEPLVHELLIALENSERIDPIFGRDVAHGRQRIAFLEDPVEDHHDDAVAKLAVDRLTVVPLAFRHALNPALTGKAQPKARLEPRAPPGCVVTSLPYPTQK